MRLKKALRCCLRQRLSVNNSIVILEKNTYNSMTYIIYKWKALELIQVPVDGALMQSIEEQFKHFHQ